MRAGKVRLEFRQYPFKGPESLWAAEASECAAEQGQFWPYYDLLFANQSGENRGAFSKDRLKGLAATLKLDLQTFDSCLDTDKHLLQVQEDVKLGDELGVNSTPTVLILGPVVDPAKARHEPPNGVMVRYAAPFSTIQQIIEKELAK